MSRLSLCTVSRYPEVVVKVVVGRMVNTRRTRGCCTILTRMTTLVREIIKSEHTQRARRTARRRSRVSPAGVQSPDIYALKGRRAHAHPSHDAARSAGARAGTREAVRVDVRGVTVEATGKDGRHTRQERGGPRVAHQWKTCATRMFSPRSRTFTRCQLSVSLSVQAAARDGRRQSSMRSCSTTCGTSGVASCSERISDQTCQRGRPAWRNRQSRETSPKCHSPPSGCTDTFARR